MNLRSIAQRSALGTWQGRAGLALILLGEILIVIRLRPISDFDFPMVWYGYILFMDAAVYKQTGSSLLRRYPRHALVMFPFSAGIWWIFELFNLAVHNWQYIGASQYTGLAYVALASLDFSTVLPAVWITAMFWNALLPRETGEQVQSRVPDWLLVTLELLGVPSVLLPIIFPTYAFWLVWGSLYFLLDPFNCLLGRPSMIAAAWTGNWRLPILFAVSGLTCGFFWEAWNFWALPKWIYHIPYVDFWHIFEMPLLGWLGYLPFGLELFALTNFLLPLVHLRPLTLQPAPSPEPALAENRLQGQHVRRLRRRG